MPIAACRRRSKPRKDAPPRENAAAPTSRATARDVTKRPHPVDHAGRDRRARHAAVLGFGILRDGQAAAFVDALDADRAVAVEARQHHRDRMRTVRVGERAEEKIDRDVPARGMLGQVAEIEVAVHRPQRLARRDDVNRIATSLCTQKDAAHGAQRHATAQAGPRGANRPMRGTVPGFVRRLRRLRRVEAVREDRIVAVEVRRALIEVAVRRRAPRADDGC